MPEQPYTLLGNEAPGKGVKEDAQHFHLFSNKCARGIFLLNFPSHGQIVGKSSMILTQKLILLHSSGTGFVRILGPFMFSVCIEFNVDFS